MAVVVLFILLRMVFFVTFWFCLIVRQEFFGYWLLKQVQASAVDELSSVKVVQQDGFGKLAPYFFPSLLKK